MGQEEKTDIEIAGSKPEQNILQKLKALVTLIGARDSAKQMKVIKGREMDEAQGTRLFCQHQIRFQKKPLSISRE